MALGRQTNWTLIGLAGVAAAFVALQPRSTDHPDKAGADKAQEVKEALASKDESGAAPEAGPLKPVRDLCARINPGPPEQPWVPVRKYRLLVSPRDGGPAVEERAKSIYEGNLYKWPKLHPDCSIQFLIATVPDPADSGFGYMFDQVVEAIQRALETEHYVIDRAWLPWKRRDKAAQPQQPDPRLHERHPGVILFRREEVRPARKPRNGSLSPLLMLLLVGETPTAGVNKVALHNSWRLIQDYYEVQGEGTLKGKAGEPIRILGPFFSGSQSSLASSLRELREQGTPRPTGATHLIVESLGAQAMAPLGGPAGSATQSLMAGHFALPQRPVHVICGSATSFDRQAFISRWWGQEAQGDLLKTTILPDALVRKWLFKFLDNPANPAAGTQPDPVVVLQETNTGFGQVTARTFRVPGKEPEEKRVISVPFPLHISQLRVSYTKEQLARMESLGLPRPARNLPIPQDEEKASQGAEAVPVQSPLMTTALTDLVLSNLLTTLAQQQTHYVCLVASDPRDKIFLGNLIRERNPDVQLCTTMGDLLFAHPDYNYALRGMIVASTYPLHPGVQAWSEDSNAGERRILFANQAFQGYFNATLAHLDDMATPTCGPSRPSATMLDYGWGPPGCATTSPGIWISAVGQNGQMIPLHHVSPEEIRKELRESEERRKSADPTGENPADDLLQQYGYVYERPVGHELQASNVFLPNMWSLLFVATLLVAGYFAWRAYYWVGQSMWSDDANGRMSALKQRIDFTCTCLALMILFGWIAEVTVVPIRHGNPFTPTPLAYMAIWLMVLFSWLAVLAAFVAALRVRGAFRLSSWRRIASDWLRVSRDSSPLRGMPDRWYWHGGFWVALADVLVLVAGLVVFGWLVGQLIVALADPPDVAQVLIRYERLVHISNGLSPLVPVFFLCAAVFAWGIFLVKKLYLVSKFSVLCPFPDSPPKAFGALNRLDKELRAEILPPSTWQQHPYLCFLMLGLLVIVFLKLHSDSIPPIDGIAFGLLCLAGFFAGSFLLIFTLCQVYLAWAKLRRLLRFLALVPTADAFGRLPEKVVSIFGHYFSSVRPRPTHLAIPEHLLGLLRVRSQKLREWLEQPAHEEPYTTRGLEGVDLDRVRRDFAEQFPTGERDDLPELFQQELNPATEDDYEQGLSATLVNKRARKCLVVLAGLWPAHSMEEAFGRSPRETKPPSADAKFLSLPDGHPVREWAVMAEDFVAVEVIRYLSQFFVQLRNLLTSLTVGSLLLLLAAVSYPFRPQSLLLVFLTLLAGTVAAFIAVFLVQVNRDELISRIMRTTPNRFTPDIGFVQATVAYVLPIVGGLMVQFPFFTSGLRSLLEPLWHIIR
jgi:hypothetical protein